MSASLGSEPNLQGNLDSMMRDETAGILRVGEVPVVVRRDSPREADFSQAWRSGAESAWKQILDYLTRAEATVPPYTDLRPYADMRTFALDRLSEVTRG